MSEVFITQPEEQRETHENDLFDFTFVYTTARIAVYDDFKSAPHIIEVEPGETLEYIERLSQEIYSQSQAQGGSIPYTVIRELSENFIHARFAEVVISIFDKGNTIRFADQGPGIIHKEQAQQPGFTSASESMKDYIRGVGSGLPLAVEYLKFTGGSLCIEDNMGAGTVITISLNHKLQPTQEFNNQAQTYIFNNNQEQPAIIEDSNTRTSPAIDLNERQKRILQHFVDRGALGVTDINRLTGMPQSSIHKELTRFEELNILEKTSNQKRVLTQFGRNIVEVLTL